MECAELNRCPHCSTISVYAEGGSVCSVACAKGLAVRLAHDMGVSVEYAALMAGEEANERGLPTNPIPSSAFRHKYVYVNETRTCMYWQVDRALLTLGLCVEYVWALPEYGKRARIYRIEAKDIPALPEWMGDYRVQGIDACQYLAMGDGFPTKDWHFLSPVVGD